MIIIKDKILNRAEKCKWREGAIKRACREQISKIKRATSVLSTYNENSETLLITHNVVSLPARPPFVDRLANTCAAVLSLNGHRRVGAMKKWAPTQSARASPSQVSPGRCPLNQSASLNSAARASQAGSRLGSGTQASSHLLYIV